MIKRIRKMAALSTITIFLVCNFLYMSVIQVYAEPRTGDIEIDYTGRTDYRDNIILSGAKFEIFPIQYLDNEVLTWRDEFADCGISLEDSSSGAREEQAKKLFQYAKDHNISGIIHVTDEAGHTHFLDLAEGVYLLAEIGDVDNGVDEFESAPFLVYIPSEVSGEFEYDVDVEPKADWVSHEGHPVGPDEPDDPDKPENPEKDPEDTPDKDPDITPDKTPETNPSHTGDGGDSSIIQKILNTVKTGDETNLIMWSLMVLISLGVMIVLYRKKIKK